MKTTNRATWFGLLTLALAGTLAFSSGCRRKPTSLTYIPGQTRPITNDLASARDDSGLKIDSGRVPDSRDTMNPDDRMGIPLPDRNKRENLKEDREFFKANTVYFEFDRSAVQVSEGRKIEAVANALKARPEASVEVEGHCDERGTEEYNRSLGERRALAVREYLINLGLSGERIFTLSFGEDKPAAAGHSEAAWSKNRRAEFILLTPKN